MADAAAEAPVLELESPSAAFPDAAQSASPRAQADSPKELPGGAVKAKKGKVQDPSADFVSVLGSRIEEIERAVAAGHGGPAEREAAKARKKQLREVVKFCSDRSNSAEDRIAFIQQKYTQQLSELLRMERSLLDLQREHEVVSKEKDKVQTELKKTNLLKDKLEELCRQLQREAREVAEESRRRNEEDVKQRQALQARFSQAIQDVSEKMDAQAAERTRQLEENEELRARLDAFLEQFETFNTLMQKKDVELQLAQARAEQATSLAQQLQQRADLLAEANEKYSSAIETFKPQLSELDSLRQRNAVLLAAKEELTAQLEHYAERFGEFQDTLQKSNETFASLRDQMEGHAKARATLTRERDEARRRAEANDSTIMALVQDRLGLKQQVETLSTKLRTESEDLRRCRTQKERLEGLCRALQAQIKGGPAAGAAAAAGAAGTPAEAGSEGAGASGGSGDGAGAAVEGEAGRLANGEEHAQGGEREGGLGAGEGGVVVEAEERSLSQDPLVGELPLDLY